MTNDALIALSQRLSLLYKNACLAEVEAMKPGNVHIFADGHGMQVQDFVKSAEASSAIIAQTDLGLGERIYHSVNATWQAVGCNTNLGIILLSAPIIQTVLLEDSADIRDRLKKVIHGASQVDATWLFKAIQLAKPAGLGRVDEHDVNALAQCTLLEAMQAAAGRDFIGQQYGNNFLNIFESGLPQYQQALLQWQKPAWATTALYLYWLSHYPDSHIARKYDLMTAKEVQKEALVHYVAFQDQTNPKNYFSELLKFDQSLKLRSINPGTSADLTVATILLQDVLEVGRV
jgi:triphosphoribosyl-dephospho-CoA synthase